MNTSNKRISILEPIFQSLIIFSCVYAGYTFTLTYDIIPKSIIRLPDVYINTNDLWRLSIIFTVVFLVFLIPMQFFFGRGVFLGQNDLHRNTWFIFVPIQRRQCMFFLQQQLITILNSLRLSVYFQR